MNHALYIIATGMFLAMPVTLLVVRVFRPKAMPWWFAFVLAAGLGWVLENASVLFYYNYLDDLVKAAGPNPPQELIDRLADDGAKQVFALLFGWAYGLVYFSFWCLVYGIVLLGRKFCAAVVGKVS